MPRFEVTVTEVKQVWTSPDGQRTISEVTMDYNGQTISAKTYSKAFKRGWTGEIESYEKPGRNGPETFVKQVPKDSGYTPSGGQSSTGGSGYGTKRTGSREFDNFTMYLSYAKDIAVALIAQKAYKAETLATICADVATAGEQLYDAHNNKDAEPSKDALNSLFPDASAAPADDDPFAGIPVIEDE